MSTKLIISLHNTNRGRKRGGEERIRTVRYPPTRADSFQPPQLLSTTRNTLHQVTISIHDRNPSSPLILATSERPDQKDEKEKNNDRRGGRRTITIVVVFLILLSLLSILLFRLPWRSHWTTTHPCPVRIFGLFLSRLENLFTHNSDRPPQKQKQEGEKPRSPGGRNGMPESKRRRGVNMPRWRVGVIQKLKTKRGKHAG